MDKFGFTEKSFYPGSRRLKNCGIIAYAKQNPDAIVGLIKFENRRLINNRLTLDIINKIKGPYWKTRIQVVIIDTDEIIKWEMFPPLLNDVEYPIIQMKAKDLFGKA